MHKLRITLPYVAVVLGAVTILAGIYAITQGASAKSDVREKLAAQNITHTDDAPEIVPGAEPGALVDDPETAEAMAQIIDAHALESTGGLTCAEMGRFATDDGDPAGTDGEGGAATGTNGQPLPNPAAPRPSKRPPCRRASTARSWASRSPTSCRASACSPSQSGSS